ncbi:hypothetical protein C0J52_13537 [Blattella germanica]|nr:hypothetical protein C0J52_13537 [Blattella germanica]
MLVGLILSLNMSLEKKSENGMEYSTSRPKSVEEAVGSHYALQVALQTMKERCQHLQKRLGVVEQENLRLRIENRKLRSDSNSTITPEDVSISSSELQSKIDRLEEKVTEFNRTKSQLTHHLYMVTNENKQLWTRLSHLTQANQNLGSHLSKISNTLSRHHSTSSIVTSKCQSPANSFVSPNKKSKDETDKAPDSPFAKAAEGERTTDLEDMESLRKWGVPEGNSYNESQSKLPDPSQYNLPPEVPTERMCPMCGKHYDKAVSFDAFQEHVTNHFIDDDESFSVINNFEVIHT